MLKVSRPVAYIILWIAIGIELMGDAMLTASNGYEHKLLGAASLLIILFSFFLFSKILHIINIAVAYATWSSVGALISAVIGMTMFNQHLTPVGWVSLIALVAGTIAIDLWGQPADEEGSQENEDAVDRKEEEE